MITQQTFARVIDAQQPYFLKKDAGVIREVLDEIPDATGFASIITGIRRCGKSTLQLQLKKRYLPGSGIYLNFEDPRIAGMESQDFERLYAEILGRKIQLLFFDEIQIIPSWELFVNQLLREGFRVIVTGSNASLLSKEMGTHLTGRHFTTELFPFSYKEFLQYKNLEKSENTFMLYMQKGGMPDYLRTKQDKYLNDLLDDILIRDIAVRYGIRDVNSLRQLAVYLLSNIGNLVSANGLTGLFGIKSGTTFLDYFSYLQNAYLIEFIPLFDYSIKKQIRNPQKIYAMDLGLYHQNKIIFSPNDGHILENVVYLQLRRKGKGIYYYQNEGECDFITTRNGNPDELYQVCTNLNSMNVKRETEGLFNAMTYFKKDKGFIITLNQRDTFSREHMKIDVIPAWEWMG